MGNDRKFIPLGVAILTVSDSRDENTDKSGTLLSDCVKTAGHSLIEKVIVPDNVYQIRAVVSNWCIDESIHAILISGGTGITGRDGTPEAISVLFDKEIEGFGEIFRAISYTQIKTSTMQSRAIAGVTNGTYIFSIPGSPNACKTAWEELISHQLDYTTRPCNLVELMPRLHEK